MSDFSILNLESLDRNLVDRARPRAELNGKRPESPRQVAQAFEQVFLQEMLKHSGLGKMRESFNGGVGEQAFQSFLTQQYAQEIAESRSIGLADQIYRQMMERGVK